jgi:hypothetical protein
LESRLDRYSEVLPLCEQIVGLGIGIGELLAFHTAVCENAEMHNLSRESAAYRVIEDIRDYDKLGGLKKQLNNISMQYYIEFAAIRNRSFVSISYIVVRLASSIQSAYLLVRIQHSSLINHLIFLLRSEGMLLKLHLS